MYKNSEGYPDPTAGQVMSDMMRDYRRKQRAERRIRFEIMNRPRVYVVSRYAGDIRANVRNARKYCRFAAAKNRIPIASHLLYPQFLNDSDEKERELGLLFGLVWLGLCDEVWVFGTDKSPGMAQEIHEAKMLKKPVRYFTETLEELK